VGVHDDAPVSGVVGGWSEQFELDVVGVSEHEHRAVGLIGDCVSVRSASAAEPCGCQEPEPRRPGIINGAVVGCLRLVRTVRAENPSTSGDRRVLVENAAEPITASDADVVQVDGFGQRP